MRLPAGKCLMVAVNCILDEFDESKLPFTRKAIFLATGRKDRVTSHRRGHLRRQGSAGGYREGGRAPSRRLRMGVSGDDLSEQAATSRAPNLLVAVQAGGAALHRCTIMEETDVLPRHDLPERDLFWWPARLHAARSSGLPWPAGS